MRNTEELRDARRSPKSQKKPARTPTHLAKGDHLVLEVIGVGAEPLHQLAHLLLDCTPGRGCCEKKAIVRRLSRLCSGPRTALQVGATLVGAWETGLAFLHARGARVQAPRKAEPPRGAAYPLGFTPTPHPTPHTRHLLTVRGIGGFGRFHDCLATRTQASSHALSRPPRTASKRAKSLTTHNRIFI